jgi:hypothetical protein
MRVLRQEVLQGSRMEAALTGAQYNSVRTLRQEIPYGKEEVLALVYGSFLSV